MINKHNKFIQSFPKGENLKVAILLASICKKVNKVLWIPNADSFKELAVTSKLLHNFSLLVQKYTFWYLLHLTFQMDIEHVCHHHQKAQKMLHSNEVKRT